MRCRAGDKAIPAPVHRGAWCGCGGGWQCPTPRCRVLMHRPIGPQSYRSLPPLLPPLFGNRSGQGIGRDRSSTSREGYDPPRGEQIAHLSPFQRGRPAGLRRVGPLATAALACVGLDCVRITTYNTIQPLDGSQPHVDASGERRNGGIRTEQLPPPSKLVKGGFRPGPQEGHEIDHVDPHDLFSGLISCLAIGMKALSPVAKGRLRDIDNLASLRLSKLLLAKPCIVSPTAKARMWFHAAPLLELPG